MEGSKGRGVWGQAEMAELNVGGSCQEEHLAAGILAILSPAVELVDGNIGEVR